MPKLLSDLRVGLKVGRLELWKHRDEEWDCLCVCGRILRAANRSRKSVPSCGPRCKAGKVNHAFVQEPKSISRRRGK